MIPVITSGNPLAQRTCWDSSCPEETPPGYRDEYFEYPMSFVVAANAFATNLFITFDREADFVLRQIQPSAYQLGVAPTLGNQVGLYRFRDGGGRNLSEDPVTAEVNGAIFPELWLPAGSGFFLDFDNTNNNFQTQVAVLLQGAKRFRL